MAAQIFHDEEAEMSVYDLGQGAIELNTEKDAWQISLEKETEVAARMAIAHVV